MSNAALTAVFDHSKTRHAARLLMLALADRADEHGIAWPSIADIMRRTRLSRGAVHGAMCDAGELGELSVERFAGPRLCNRYQIHLATRSDSEPVQDMKPVQSPNGPVQSLHKTRSDSEPKPSVTRKNHKAKASAEPLDLPHGEPFATAWSEFATHRRELRHPMTPTAGRRLLTELAAVPEAQAVAALHESICRGWRGVFPNGRQPTEPKPVHPRL
jgi:hypothetical protein